MNRIIFSALLLSTVTANAQQQQVGINTAEPKATLHVEAGASENKGVIIPRITAAQMKTMTGLAHFGADHHAIITYLKEDLPSADQTGKLAEVKEAGYYFYNHTAGKWQKLGGGGEQDFKAIPGLYGGYSYLSKKSGVGGNGTSVGTGEDNIAIGQDALYSNTTGNNNIAQGKKALYSNTTGSYNIAQGYQALYSNTTGSFNIAQGGGALQNNTIGRDNIAQGYNTLRFNVSGESNIAQGSGALQNNTTGNYNIAQGFQALFNNTTGQENIAIGNSALRFNSIGEGNIGMGAFALQGQSTGVPMTGRHNIALGGGTLSNNSTGEYNIALGASSLYNNISGVDNIAQGRDVLHRNTTGGYNIGMGYNALFFNTIGGSNIALGKNTLRGQSDTAPMSGNFNIALGDEALYNNTTGKHNVAQGYQALSSNTTGENNIAQGHWALHYNTTGNNNIALGENALKGHHASFMTGNNNIALGRETLSSNIAGSYNAVMGMSSGKWIKGNANIHIGLDTDEVIPNASGELNNVIAIGHFDSQGSYPLNTTTANDNVILLGNASPTAPKVGIGTYKPGAKLEINNGTTAGAVKIVDGTEGAGKVLTSDADGLATWKSITLFTGTERIGAYHWGVGTALGNTNWNKIASITVPPGASMVYVKIHLMSGGLGINTGYTRAYVGKKDIGWNSSSANDTPIGGSTLFASYAGKDFELQTSFIYNNTTGSHETLYLNLQSDAPTIVRSGFEYPNGTTFLGTTWVENQFSAIPVN